MFVAGQQIFYRGVHVTDSGAEPPALCDVKPALVAEDSGDLVALWVLAGTSTKMSRPIDRAQPKPWRLGEWEFVESVWDRWNALFLIQPGAWHATWAWWTPNWDFLGWYVNLQEPLVRTDDGFDHRDLQLDIVVEPDRTWRWKDEDDLARSIETGVISAVTAARVRAEAARVVALIESGAYPFVPEMATVRPDPALAIS